MTPGSGVPAHVTGDELIGITDRDDDRIHLTDVPFSRRTWARVFSRRYDLQLDDEMTAVAGTPLAAHTIRLTSRRERDELAKALTLLLGDVDQLPGDRIMSTRVPTRTDAIAQSADVLRDVLARLLGPLPVHARGVARLRLLLSDGRGPFYRTGTGSLAAAMRGVLAAL